MIDIALFPIPGCVTFPGSTFPLHVFEPRYRRMVEHCVRHGTPVGICHTMSLLSPGQSGQSAVDALRSNQATYKPCSIFSAGSCELLETLDDGRLLIQVHLNARYEVLEIRQSLPFVLASCREYHDHPLAAPAMGALRQLKEKVLMRLLALTHQQQEVHEVLHAPVWQEADPQFFSLQIFGLVQLDTEIQQSLLENRSPLERLETLLDALSDQ